MCVLLLFPAPLQPWERKMQENMTAQKCILGAKEATHWVNRQWIFDIIRRQLPTPATDGRAQQRSAAIRLRSSSPGFGNSALAAEGIKTMFSSMGWNVAAFHFCVKGDSSSCSSLAFVLSIAGQLHSSIPGYRRYLHQHDEVKVHFDEESLERDGGWVSLLEGVWKPLAIVARDLRLHRYSLLIVDSLNESLDSETAANNSSAIGRLLQKSAEFLSSEPRLSWLCMLLTSRGTDADLARILPDIPVIDIETEAARNQIRQDLTQFVERRLNSSPTLELDLAAALEFQQTPSSRDGVVRMFVQKSNGVFRWASAVLTAIEQGDNGFSFSRLDEIPSALNDQFFASLRNAIPEAEFPVYRPVLELLMSSFDAASEEELLDAAELDGTLPSNLQGHFSFPEGRNNLERVLDHLFR